MNPKNRLLSRAAFAALLTALVSVVSLRASAPAVAPVVANPGFEASPGLTGWTTAGTVSLTSAVVHTGSSAASVTVAAPGTDGVSQSLLGQMIPGRSYLVSAWVKLGSGAAAARIGLHLSSTVNGIVNPSAGLAEQALSDGASPQWHYVSGAFELDTNAAPTALGLLITSDDVATNFYVDDVAVYPLAATGVHNIHFASQISALGAGAARQPMNLYTFEDNLGALTTPGSWSIVAEGSGHVLKQTSPYFSTICNLSPGVAPGAGSWTNYVLSADVRLDQVTTAKDGTATLRFGNDGLGDGYALTIGYTPLGYSQLVLSKAFTTGTQFLGSWSDTTVGTAIFHTYTVTFPAYPGTIAVTRDGSSVISAPVDPSLTAGGIGLGTFRCEASFDNVSVTPIGGGTALFGPDDFEHGMNWTGNNSTPFAQLTSVGGAGVPVVFTLSFSDPRNTGSVPVSPAAGSAAYTTETGEIATFLTTYGQYCSIFAVENEPNNEYSLTDRTVSGGTSPAIEWLKAVAQTVKTTIAANPSTLGGLKVASGAMTTVLNAYTNLVISGVAYRSSTAGLFLQAMLNWANTDPNIDFIDFHAHQASEQEVEQVLSYLQGQTTKPLISTEWSEAAAVNTWIGQQISADNNTTGFVPSAPGITTSSTNLQYVQATYLSPVPQDEWNKFVGMSPLGSDPNFLQNVTDLYNRNGVVVETYGGYDQYKSATFDMKQIYATLTVKLSAATATPPNAYQTNANYFTQFTSLTPTLPAPADQIYFENFSSGAGAWTPSGGSWSVSTGTDPSYQQTAGSGLAYALINSPPVSAGLDSRVAAEITPTAFNTSTNAVGLVARYKTGPLQYYSVLYHGTGSHTLVIQRISGGTTALATTSIPALTTGQTHRFELDVQGNKLAFYVDNVEMLHATDTATPLVSGQGGLITNNATANFDNVDVRQPQYVDDSTSAANWTSPSGSWSEGAGGFTQSATSVSALAYLGGLTWSDYTVTALAAPTDNEGSTSYVGLVARYTSGTGPSYYALVYRPQTTPNPDILLIKVVGGTSTTLRDLPITLGTTPPFGLKLEVQGSQIRGYLNGRMICSELDSSPLTSGSAGVITNNATGTFANVLVTQLNP